jgi:hypothetical protein
MMITREAASAKTANEERKAASAISIVDTREAVSAKVVEAR